MPYSKVSPPDQISDDNIVRAPSHTDNIHDMGFYDKVKSMCDNKVLDEGFDLSPPVFADSRKQDWPQPNDIGIGPELSSIYRAVLASGLPNAIGACIQLPTELNLEAWDRNLSSSPEDRELMNYIRCGFPLGYMGPVSDSRGIPNHSSALKYPGHVSKFVTKELSLGGIVGPMDKPPFREWCHVSPLMSREKKGTDDRRIIIDMTYPHESSVNSFICKNTIMGVQHDHRLPTIDDLTDIIKEVGSEAYVCSTDVSRAYKNFKTCPLDWPLLAFEWDQKYFCDISMPFGARSSSSHMQRIAQAIVGMLARRGITCLMYLDDLVAVSRGREAALRDFAVIQELLSDLGLPQAHEKVQPPDTKVRWLGVDVDVSNMTISLPQDKLIEVQACVAKTLTCKTISRKHLQSLLGKLIHIGKCVRPARLFVSRLLEGLRNMKRKFTKVTDDMRSDLYWFQEFVDSWNGVSLIPKSSPGDKVIYTDASGSGIGALDGLKAYGGQISPVDDPAANITELEATNIVVAVHTFLTERDRGSHITIHSDSLSSVQVFRTGRGRNPILLDCARHLWMAQAILDVTITYQHVKGEDNSIADALSRLHLGTKYRDIVKQYSTTRNVSQLLPVLHVFKCLSPSIYSRRGVRMVPDTSCAKTAGCPCPGDD